MVVSRIKEKCNPYKSNILFKDVPLFLYPATVIQLRRSKPAFNQDVLHSIPQW